jgi:ankyrin repeat protein
MLARGANQNAQDERGRTSLYFAITGNHKEVVFYLIENGCNINIYDSNFGSPLQKALTMANLDLVSN